MSTPIGDPREAGKDGPAGDQREGGAEGVAGDPREAGQEASGGIYTVTSSSTPSDSTSKGKGASKK